MTSSVLIARSHTLLGSSIVLGRKVGAVQSNKTRGCQWESYIEECEGRKRSYFDRRWVFVHEADKELGSKIPCGEYEEHRAPVKEKFDPERFL